MEANVGFKGLDKGVSSLQIVIKSEIDEESLRGCCKEGKKYLLFLYKRPDGYYQAINGPYSVIPIGTAYDVEGDF
jgi:hypothetical protein